MVSVFYCKNDRLKNIAKENFIKTFQETDPTQEIELTHESIVACTSAKFVQLNAAENGQVFGFGFRKEDDRQTFQNIIQVLLKVSQEKLVNNLILDSDR